MPDLYEVEVELTDCDFGRVDFLVGFARERAETLGEPYTRHLGGKVRERFHLLRQQTRGDVLAGARPSGGLADRPPQDPQRRDCRSRTCPRAQKICEATHCIAHDSYEREGNEMSADHHSYEAIARQRRGSAEYREETTRPAVRS